MFLYYLASPYTHKNKEIQKKRLKDISIIGSELTKKGVLCIHPIASSATLVKHGSMKGCFDTWATLDLEYVRRCDAVLVADLDGWKESIGVTAEIEYARSHSKGVFILDHKKALKGVIEINALHT